MPNPAPSPGDGTADSEKSTRREFLEFLGVSTGLVGVTVAVNELNLDRRDESAWRTPREATGVEEFAGLTGGEFWYEPALEGWRLQLTFGGDPGFSRLWFRAYSGGDHVNPNLYTAPKGGEESLILSFAQQLQINAAQSDGTLVWSMLVTFPFETRDRLQWGSVEDSTEALSVTRLEPSL